MSVTYPAGFVAAGVTAGFKPSGALDLGLLVADPGATVACLFTTNRVSAAPVRLSRSRLSEGAPRAVLVNSGQANAATGERGEADAIAATAAVAEALRMDPHDVLQCSTGVIGEPLHMPELLEAVPKLAATLGREGGQDFARAILTTDTVEKQATARAGRFRVGGCAKGVGMIAPSLATMLAFVTTDAPVAVGDLGELARSELRPRFEALTVDGCTSTNDSVLLFASGAAGGASVPPGSSAWDELADAVGAVGAALARRLIADAEGARHVLVVDVEGAATGADARSIAKAVAGSALVKTAAFGGDPNPGRILQAVGSSDASVDPSLIDVSVGGVPLASAGAISAAYFEDAALLETARSRMRDAEIHIGVRIGDGAGRSRALGCDLSYEYVRINGEYTT